MSRQGPQTSLNHQLSLVTLLTGLDDLIRESQEKLSKATLGGRVVSQD